ncbi:MAG: DNA polymerase III subunit alpha [Patescibacteria group bacterium]
MQFVHLHNHTHYSLLDGLTKIDELIQAAKDDGAEAVAITDHGVMYGVVEFYQKCKKAGIKPIIGVEAYLAPESRHNKVSKADENFYHLLLLAKNNKGYKNLIKLTTIAHLEGFYYKPRIDWEVLEKYSDGLIGATACMGGEIPKLIRAGKIDKAKARILEYNKLFGQDNFYLEIMPHPEIEGLEEINKKLIEFSKELNIPLVATNDVHYLRPEDEEAQDILLCLQNKRKKEDKDRLNMTDINISFKGSREMAEAFKDYPEAIANTVKIAEKCNVEIELGITQLPFFSVPNGDDGNSYLKKLCQAGLEKRYKKTYQEIDKEIQTRLDYELSVIEKMDMSSYFLIVADFVNWAKDNRIVVGPGRGSAAGSLVCFLTGITNLDPIKYELLFERFLNPDRISMPDIDMDFADTRRDDVIRYVEKKYGEDHVAQIITFGTMAARAAVRDVGRVLDYPYDYCDRLAKMIPMFARIDQALKESNELKEIYKQEEAARKILDYARRLEGVARHASTHACGVVITKDPLTNYVPLQYASSADRSIVSQYSLHPIEDLGLLKMDFLGLKNLTIIESAIRIIKNTRNLLVNIDNIPLDDKATYKLFQAGETTGIFQFESSGMKRYLRELKPTEFEDIIAMVALYRPGPMEWIPDYIIGKHGKKKVTYLHQKLEPILAKTYGVAIYQEQVMQIARDLAGFTMGEADVLRKAVGKKIPELLAKQKEKFIEGCVKNSIPDNLAQTIFSFIEPFAGYGFNRSHAACYALIGYQTAYLKAHWPAEFMAALLTADQQNTDRVAIEIEECRKMEIKVMPPDINESYSTFTVVTSGTKENQAVSQSEEVKTIRFGLKAIKNVGEHIAEEIIRERKENGPFRDMSDFLERVTDKDLNKKSLESLIKCGAFDNFNDRSELLNNLEAILNFNKEASRAQTNGQNSLFADLPTVNLPTKIKLVPTEATPTSEKLAWEKELLGLYISDHPIKFFRQALENLVTPLANLVEIKKNELVNISGVITSIKKIITRANEPMMFVKIEDTLSSIEILVFPRLLKETIDIWHEGKIIISQGRLSNKDQDLKFLANFVLELNADNTEKIINEFKSKAQIINMTKPVIKANYRISASSQNNLKKIEEPLKIIFKKELTAEKLDELKKIFLINSGASQVVICLEEKGQKNIIATGFRVNKSLALISEINDKFSEYLMVVDKKQVI